MFSCRIQEMYATANAFCERDMRLATSSALLSQSMLCGRLPRSSAMKSPGMGKFAHAAFNAAAGELVFAAADACLTLTTGLGLHSDDRNCQIW